MDPNSSQIGAYEFGEFRLDVARRTLSRGVEIVPLTSKAFEMLFVLVERADRVVSKEELMQALWPKSVVEEANLSQNVFVVRKALGESAQQPRYIVTVAGVGYRFAGDVRSVALAAIATTPATPKDAAPAAHARWRRQSAWLTAASVIVLVLIAGAVLLLPRIGDRLAASSVKAGRIVLGDVANRSGEPVFDRTLREALAINLAQSPFLDLLSDAGLQSTLQLMNREPGAPLVRESVLEVCRRRGLDAVLDGSIVRLGHEYLLTLEAVGCEDGVRIGSAQARAASKEQTLDALSQAANVMRARLGESLESIRNSSRPLREATTASLEALQAFTTGAEIMRHAPDASAGIPLFERAIELDPTFATAYAYLSILFMQLGETERAAELQGKAYALRDRVSERERYLITAYYHFIVTGDLDRETAIYELWIARYPHDWPPRASLVELNLSVLGNYPKALALASECNLLEPDQPYCAETVASAHLAMNEIAPARAVLERAITLKLDHPMLHAALYRVATLQRDDELATAQREWSSRQPVQDDLGSLFAIQLGQDGRLKEFQAAMRAHAHELSARGFGEIAADDLTLLALTEMEYGDAAASRTDAAASLALSRGRDVLGRLAISFALGGHASEATALLDELQKRFPRYFVGQRIYVPLTRALLLAHAGQIDSALETLRPLGRFEAGLQWSLRPAYVRGLLLLQKGDGPAAEREFRTIIARRGVATFAPEWALAHLGAARAAALAHRPVQSAKSYRDFFALWKAADADIPVHQQAKAEYARLD